MSELYFFSLRPEITITTHNLALKCLKWYPQTWQELEKYCYPKPVCQSLGISPKTYITHPTNNKHSHSQPIQWRVYHCWDRGVQLQRWSCHQDWKATCSPRIESQDLNSLADSEEPKDPQFSYKLSRTLVKLLFKVCKGGEDTKSKTISYTF